MFCLFISVYILLLIYLVLMIYAEIFSWVIFVVFFLSAYLFPFSLSHLFCSLYVYSKNLIHDSCKQWTCSYLYSTALNILTVLTSNSCSFATYERLTWGKKYTWREKTVSNFETIAKTCRRFMFPKYFQYSSSMLDLVVTYLDGGIGREWKFFDKKSKFIERDWNDCGRIESSHQLAISDMFHLSYGSSCF